MVETASTMLALGTKAPEFRLPDTAGNTVVLDDYKGAPALLIAFICNHCPFVKHVRQGLAALGRDYQVRGVAIVAINSNDIVKYPDDSPQKMAEEVVLAGYTFPYLLDDSQEVARKYRAACTPDFYVFDSECRLAYRGQMDDSRPGNCIPVTGVDLRAALDAVLEKRPAPADQTPSIGCNIKWKPGNEPDYFPA